jgi:hypothetical protein
LRQLRFVGLAEDGDSLVLESPTGESYRLPMDERVRAACRGDLTRLGQIEIEMDNPLRPREIQTRVRAGESAEQIAAASGMPLERVLRFAYAVLQERGRVIAQARSTPVGPRAAEALGDLVEERLISRGTDAETLEWDAWRREDGRWAIRLAWRHGDREHAANWSLDLVRRALQAEDPAAEQLIAQEFHARTVTAVTPLAVAARAADSAPRPTRRTTPVLDTAQGPRPTPDADRPNDARPTRPTRLSESRPGESRPGESRPGESRPSVEEIRAGGRRPGSDRRADPPPPSQAQARTGGEKPAVEAKRAGGEKRSVEAKRSGREARARSTSRSAETRSPSGRSERNEDAGDDPPAEADEVRQIASGGGTVPLIADPDDGAEDDRARRATVPSWDDILLGVRRRH